jgi:Zn-dependent protease with chaperone function
MTSNIKTVLLLGLLTGLILLIGGAVGGQFGLIIGLILALVMNVGSYWYSDKIVLRLYKAREVEPQRLRHGTRPGPRRGGRHRRHHEASFPG